MIFQSDNVDFMGGRQSLFNASEVVEKIGSKEGSTLVKVSWRGLTCEVTTSSSVKSIATGADGPLFVISEVDVGVKASLVEWWKSGSMADNPLLGCTLTGSN
jgi:hypothetical protein